MPRISEFYGIVIKLHTSEHPPPHFHARYGGDEAVIAIATGKLLAGKLPVRQLRLVRQWLSDHRFDLHANWNRARNDEPLRPIFPLK